MIVNLDTWIISDTHFRHKNIIKLCNRPLNHDSLMEKNWRSTVAVPETILHLGDIATWYGDVDEAHDIISGLPGKKYLILGNHDKHPASWYESAGWIIVEPFTQNVDGKRIRFSHYPETQVFDWDINIHGHIHNNGYPPNADPRRDYRNVSVEIMDYTPVQLSAILYKGRFASHKELGFSKHELQKRRR